MNREGRVFEPDRRHNHDIGVGEELGRGIRLVAPVKEDVGGATRELSKMADREFVLGVRPEDIYISANGEADKKEAGSASLDVVEPMGNEIVFYATAGATSLVARVAPTSLPDVGSDIRLWFDTSKLHFFDAQTEEAID